MNWKTENQGMYTHQKNHVLRTKYFNKYLHHVYNIVNFKIGDKVLDFGGGEGTMRDHLAIPGEYYIYDKYPPNHLPSWKDVKDYYISKKQLERMDFDVILANHVLEHLTELELHDFCKMVLKKKPRVLVVSLPMETIVGTLLSLYDGIYFANLIEHSTKWDRVCNVLSKYFVNTKIETLWFMTIITRWELRDLSQEKVIKNE